MNALIDSQTARRLVAVMFASMVLPACGRGGSADARDPSPRLVDHAADIHLESPIPLDDPAQFARAAASVLIDEPLDAFRDATDASFSGPWILADGGDGAEGGGELATEATADGSRLRLAAPSLWLRQLDVDGTVDLHLEVRLRVAADSRVRLIAAERELRPAPGQLRNRGLAKRLLTNDAEGNHPLAPIGTDGQGITTFAVDLRPAPQRTTILLAVVCEQGSATLDRLLLTAPSRLARVLFRNRTGNQPLFITSYEAGREARDAIILPSGALARVTLDIPAQAPRLTFGAVSIDDRPRPGYRITVTVRAGEEVLEQTLAILPDAKKSPDWIDLELDLARFAGRTAEIRFAVTCRVPAGVGVAIGTPIVDTAIAPASLPMDVVVVSLDTVRADRLGAYGYGRPISPHFDELAARSAIFQNVVSASAWTLPSHVSLFTGQLPERHRVESQVHRLLPGIAPLLAQEFRERGYQTWACSGGGFVTPGYGFAEGFERFGSVDPAYPDLEWAEQVQRTELIPRARDAKVERARLLNLLRAPRRRPLFLFAHTYVAHNYQIPPSQLRALGVDEADLPRLLQPIDLETLNQSMAALASDAERRQIAADLSQLYDGGIAMADALLGEIVAALRAGGHLERTLLVVVSDHGEELFERGMIGHRESLHEELLRIPLLIAGPSIAPARILDLVALVDVAPTVRELCGLPAPHQNIDGRSLTPLLRGERLPELPALSSVLRTNGEYLRALRGRQLKLIETVDLATSSTYELFDLTRDPAERKDLAGRTSPELNILKLNLARQIRAIRDSGGAAATNATLSAETLAELKTLGYLGGK